MVREWKVLSLITAYHLMIENALILRFQLLFSCREMLALVLFRPMLTEGISPVIFCGQFRASEGRVIGTKRRQNRRRFVVGRTEERRKGGIIAGGQNPEECGPSLELGVHCTRARLPSLRRESCE